MAAATPAHGQTRPKHLRVHDTLPVYDIRECCNVHTPVPTLVLLHCPGNDLVSRHYAKRTAHHRRWHRLAECYAQASASAVEVLAPRMAAHALSCCT